MDNRKFEQLIDMIINENEEQARELFHEIVVEKSREIYESMMDEEDDMMESGDMVGDLMDEVESDDQMAMEDAMEEDMDEEHDLDDISMDMDDMGHDEEDEMHDEADLEDRVVDLEDKLDELMAEFEEIMGSHHEEEGAEEEEEGEEDEAEAMMEAIQLKQVPGLYGSKIGGDNGAQTKSTVSKGPKVPGNGAAPVKFSSGADEKGRSAPTAKTVEGGDHFQNSPNSFKQPNKAPAPVKTQASGVNTKDVVPGN